MALTRQQLGQVFRPVGPKVVIQSAIPQGFAAASLGGIANLTQLVDLSLPIRGFRIVFKGRLVVGTANFTTAFPESFLAGLSRILMIGTNGRQKGQVTLWDIDLATLWMIQHLVGFRSGQFDINGTEVAIPDTPMPTFNALATGTFDFRVIVDLPVYPFNAPPGVKPQFLIRNEEWKDTINIQITFGTQAGAGATGFLGVSAATTTVTWSAFGSGTGSPTVDIYSLPVVMGLDLKDQFLPGFMTRVSQPITTVLQTAGPQNTNILNLQKQPTTRIFIKTGTSTFPTGNPAFATLSDTNLTTSGLVLGNNRFVRNNVDVFAHKQELVEAYQLHGPIQGYHAFDFVPSGNPDSAYPGDLVGEGSTFQLQGTVAGVANGAGIIIQEQALYSAEGPLYSF